MIRKVKCHMDSNFGCVAICGQIGSGKSEMAFRIANILDVKHKFWISASNPTRLKEGFEDIARRLFLNRVPTYPGGTFYEVKAWLEEPENGSWLVIFDDFIESTEEDGLADSEIAPHPLPLALSHGRVIITTCHRATALKLTNFSEHLCFDIPMMLEEEACELLLNRANAKSWFEQDLSHQNHTKELVRRLDNNPSAIFLAAAYIKLHRSNGETISTYLKSLRGDYHHQLFSTVVSNRYSGVGPSRPPTLALERMFLYIQEQSNEVTESALDLLALMSCLDRMCLPWELLICFINCETTLRRLLGMLSNHMLIIPYNEGTYYSMPSLVQITAHAWLHRKNRRLEWQCKALDVLFKWYEKIAGKANGSGVQAYVNQLSLLPHVDTLVQYCKRTNKASATMHAGSNDRIAQRAPALVCFASLYAGEGRSRAAQVLLSRVCTHYPKDDFWKLLALTETAEILRSSVSSTRYTKAETKARLKKGRNILKHARKISQKLRSRDAEIDVLGYLASNYLDDSRFKLAEKFQEEIIKFREEQYPAKTGEIQLPVIDAKLRFSKVLFQRGGDVRRDKDEKERYLKQTRELQESLLSEMSGHGTRGNHDHAATTCEIQANLARTYYTQGALADAISMATRAREGRLKLFGPYDLWTINVEQDLAFCLWENAEVEKARDLYREARKKLVEKLGERHWEVRKCDERGKRLFEENNCKPCRVETER
ncbi:hypothetical protein BGZ60DRAFT_266414 [Tricladium varicosporioides]|nr:hypothetical protein BGZ60DRAFT_266414 [Hymenoscyphus varicosporioides]